MTQTRSLAELVRSFRAEARLTQEALAERAGLSVHALSDLENGIVRHPRSFTVSLLEEALELDQPKREALRSAARRRDSAVAMGIALPAAIAEQLIGREEDLAAVQSELAGGESRLFTLTGTAGVGKTALAFHTVRAVASGFARVIAVELGALTDPSLVPAHVGGAAGVRTAPADAIVAAIVRALPNGRTLLFLDNFEHVAEAAPFVEALLAAHRSLQVLVTSRAPLRLRGETVYTLAPLAVPANDELDPDSLMRVASIALFVERTSALGPAFAVTVANAAAVRTVVRALAGVPLAIELAAPLMKVLSAAALAGRLDVIVSLLAGAGTGVPARQQSMRSALEWSYDLLTEPLRRAFRRLSVFRGEFNAATARRVLGDATEPDPLTTLHTIGSLVDQSLVRASSEDPAQTFELFAYVREFAEEKLRESGEFDEVHERLAEHCLAAASLVTWSPDAQNQRNLEMLAIDGPNFDAVFTWALAAQRLELALRLGVALWPYWWLGGRYYDGLTRLRAVLAAAERKGGDLGDALISEGYLAASGLAGGCGLLDEADAFTAKALPLKRRIGDEKSVATVLSGAAVAASQRGDYQRAHALLDEGLQIRRRLGEPRRIANSLCDLAQNAANAGDTAAAAAYLEESIALFRACGSEVGLGVAFAILGLVAVRARALDRADTFSRESLVFARRVGHAATVGLATTNLGRVALYRGDFETARSFLSDAFDAYESSHDAASIPEVLDGFAALALARGDPQRAARWLGAAAARRERERITVVAAERDEYDALAAAVRDALPPGLFETEVTIGSALDDVRPLYAAG